MQAKSGEVGSDCECFNGPCLEGIFSTLRAVSNCSIIAEGMTIIFVLYKGHCRFGMENGL